MSKEVGVALLVGFIAGAVFLLGQLMYAQIVVMPSLVAAGSGVLAVAVDARLAAGVAIVAFVVYLAWRMGSRGTP